ncbi:hypothetical protein C5B42_03175, partial [Candidatus Cerribacteria bacterium 'Amazon FNV 2010 28 9']
MAQRPFFLLALLVLVVFGTVAFLATRHPGNVEAAWFDNNWRFRERIALTNTSGSDQTNWQTKITFDTATPITAGKMLSSCNDIRFTSIVGKTLPYWIEPGTCNSSSTIIWVKVDSIPNGGGQIYIYYGNPSAASANYKTSDVFIRDLTGDSAVWPLQDSTSTQSYASVNNPAVNIGSRNVVLNSTPTSSTSWTLNANWAFANNLFTHTTGATNTVTQALAAATSGKAYSITYTVSGMTAGTITVSMGASGTARSANGTYTESIVSTSTTLTFTPTSTFDGSISNFSVTQVNIPPSGGTATQLLTDGNMEAAGTSAWTGSGLSKGTTTPHSGSQYLHISTNSALGASQTILTVGQVYRVYGYARSGDGVGQPIVLGINNFGTTSTTWQPFDLTFVATSTTITFAHTNSGASTVSVDFDDVTVALDTNIRSDSILSTLDGNMEQSGTSYWTAGNSATLSKDSGSPHTGTQDLKVARNGVNNPYASQTGVMISGRTYHVTGFLKSDGNATPTVSAGTTTEFTGTTSTSYQSVDITFVAPSTNDLRLGATTSTGTQFAQFDDFVVQEVDPLVGQTGNNGANVTIGAASGGHLANAYSFNGTNNYVNIYSSDLNSAFNPSEGTVVAWAKVSGSGVWTDGTSRYALQLQADANNLIYMRRTTTNNQLQFVYESGGTVNQVLDTSLGGSTGWFQVVITWSKSNNQMKAYINGAQVGSTQTGLGTWVGNLNTGATRTVIGASDNVVNNPWSGLINDVHVYSRA